MLGKLAGMAQAAKDRVVDAVSEVDLSSVKGALSSTVGAVTDKARDLADGVGDRMTHPADAYDLAISDAARLVGIDGDLLADLRKANPYR
jgi:hypothetical protein